MAKPNPVAVFRLLRRAGVGRARIVASVLEAAFSREARGVHRLLALHERTHPGRAAIVQGERRLSYEDLARRVRRVAGALGARGIGPGARAVTSLSNCAEMVIVNGALRTLGAQSVPASPHFKRDELRHILTDARAEAFFFAADRREEALAAAEAAGLERARLVEIGAVRGAAAGPTFEDLLAGPDLPLPPDDIRAPDEPAIMYTSGTTGVPKGARPTLPDSMGLLERFGGLFRLGSDETVLIPAPLYHAAPAMLAQLSILLGATLVLPAKFDPVEILKLIERERVTFAYFVPYMLEALLRLPAEEQRRYDRSSLRGAVSAAAALRPETRIAACDLLGDILCEFYGSTETGLVTFLHPEEQRRKADSVGRPIEGVRLQIAGEDGREAAPGATGEILVKSAWLRTEYVGRPEETREAHRAGFFATGDLGFLDEEGYLHVSGRVKDMVNTAGVKVFPAEVERALGQHPAVADVAVLGVADPRWGEAVWAAIVRAEGAALDEAALTAWAKERLAGFKVPKRVVFEAELPRNPAGKVLKRVLKERYEKGGAAAKT
jgi:long-chain acyl-CoA synthetase